MKPFSFMRQFSISSLVKWRLSLFLVLCLVLGGTSQAILSMKWPLYIASLIIIGFVLTSRDREPLRHLLNLPVILGGTFLGLFLLYLIPFPSSVWSQLPGRSSVVEAFSLAQLPLPWLPLSLTPEDSLMSIWNFLPPIAIILILVLDLKRSELQKTHLTLLALAFVSVILGLLQMLGGNFFYFYKVSNFGYPVGFFSNANHQACFLAMLFAPVFYFSQPFRSIGGLSSRGMTQKNIFAFTSLFLMVVCIILTDSIAGYLIVMIAFLLSVLGFYNIQNRPFLVLGVLGAILGLLLFDFLFFGNFGNAVMEKIADAGGTSRFSIYNNLVSEIDMISIFGTGPGSFYNLYIGIEDRLTMNTKYVSQAHNDYLQVLLELGIPGFLIMIGALMWVLYVVRKMIFKDKGSNPLKLAAGIAVLCALIASLPDYPLRTIGLSSLMVFYIILMAGLERKLTD